MHHRLSRCGDCPWRTTLGCWHPRASMELGHGLGMPEKSAPPPRGCPLRGEPDTISLAPGPQVFRLELPISSRKCVKAARSQRHYRYAWAPTMNEYSGLPGWQKSELRKAIDQELVIAGTRWDGWQMGVKRAPAHPKTGSPGKLLDVGRGRRRLLQVTRYSRNRPDEPGSVDSIGGKIPLDRLVSYGVLVDDSREWCLRDASWAPALSGEGRVVVEVFEMLPLPEEKT